MNLNNKENHPLLCLCVCERVHAHNLSMILYVKQNIVCVLSLIRQLAYYCLVFSGRNWTGLLWLLGQRFCWHYTKENSKIFCEYCSVWLTDTRELYMNNHFSSDWQSEQCLQNISMFLIFYMFSFAYYWLNMWSESQIQFLSTQNQTKNLLCIT